jgi:hypothetical protein
MVEYAPWEEVLRLQPLMHDVETLLPHLCEATRRDLLMAVSHADGDPSRVKIALAAACHDIDQAEFRRIPALSFMPFGEVEGVNF